MSGGLTKSWVQGWTADHLWDALPKIAQRSELLENAFANHVAEVAAPGGTQWRGQANDAAVDQAQEAQSVARRQIGVKDRAQEAITQAAHEGEARKRLAMDAISAAERSGYTVIEDLTKDQVVVDTQPCRDADESMRRALSAKTHSQIVKEKAAALWATDANLETTLNRLAAELSTHQYPGSNGAVPATVPAGTDPNAIDPKVLDLLPGVDPRATTPAGAVPGGFPDLLDAASKAAPPVDPRAGSLTDQLVRTDPSVLGRMSHLEKIPGVDPNSPAAKQAADQMRRIYQAQGMPPAQIEAKIQETLKAGSQDRYVAKLADPNAPSASPSEHVSRDFGEQWNRFFAETSDGGAAAGNAMLQEGKELTGQAGPGGPGVAEAWKDLGTNTAKGLWDYVTATPQERLDWLSDEAHRAADNPGHYLGEKLVQGAAGAATAPIGGEALAGARGLLGDLTHHLPDAPGTHHIPTQVDHPTPTGGLDNPTPNAGGWNHSIEHYSPQAPQLATDLNNAFTNGHATSDLAGQVADHSTHHAPGISRTANPDRVVLGKWAGDDAGYIGEARHNGGIYYDTGDETWNAIGHGLSRPEANNLGWQVNEQFLKTQMENGIPRIDYVTKGTGYSSIDDVLLNDANSFSAREIKYLLENAPKFGYERIGDSWIRIGGR